MLTTLHPWTTPNRKQDVMRLKKKLAAVGIVLMAALVHPLPAFASGSGGSGSGGSAPACATIVTDVPYTFGRGSLKFVFAATLTNCGTTATKYTMKVSDVSTHADPLCAINSSSYTINFPIPAGASQWYWQATGAGVCVTDHYDLKVEVFSGSTALTTATVGWN